MDTNLMGCPKCGHTVSVTAVACAYCGAAISSGDSTSQPDQGAPGAAAKPAEPPQLPGDEIELVSDTADESAAGPAQDGVKTEAEQTRQRQPEKTQPKIKEPAAEAVPPAEDQASRTDDPIDFQLPDDELVMEFEADEHKQDPEPSSGAGAVSAGPGKAAEVIALSEKASGNADRDDSPGLPQAPVLEVSAEDPSESETLGAGILELVEDGSTEPESKKERPPETTKSSGGAAAEKKAEPAPDLKPDISGTADGELEAILLTTGDEVQSAAASLPTDLGEDLQTGEPEKPAELAAAATGVAVESDESSAPAKADAIQKQKTALAKAQALKNKKLKLAQALKRKKAAMLKAQALEKQKKARAGIEKANEAKAAVSNPPGVDNLNMIPKSMKANTKMLGLLKKYQGQAIGINYDNSADIKAAELVGANDEFFSVFVKDQELNYTFPLRTILTIIEGQDGVETGKSEQKAKFKAVIKVYPLVLF